MEVKKETDVKYVHYGDIHTNIADEIDKNNNLPFINEIYKEYDELKLDDVIVADASEDYKGIADAAVIISNLPYTIIAGLHTIALRPTSLIKGYFLYHIFKTENFKRFGYKIGTGLKVFGISYNNLAKYKVYYPQEIEEQKKIIGILSNLTNSINLHERKCEELALIKKALLQKLFPKKDEINPEVRYKNFNDAWEQRKLGEVAHIETGKLDANAMVENGKYDFYTSGIKKYRIDIPAFKGPAITIAGNGATVGYMHLADGEFNAYQRTYVLTKFLANRHFIFSEIGNKLPRKIQQESRAGNIPYIVMDMLTDLQLFLPSIAEQEKVGELLNKLNSLITLHQRKLEKLKQLKKFLLQNMFI